MKNICILLHNIRSVYNVGAIFRTADALGVSKIYLSGYTPTPLDRFGIMRKDFAKSALGAEKTMSWEYSKSPLKVINKLKDEKFKVIAVEQDKKSVDYKKAKIGSKNLIILGNEVSGVSKNLLLLSDVIVEIPMRGKKESLNVSVSAGIVLFRLFDK
jgi:tRNA G18 (ribose-2'-O)-methylase SpoU